MRHSSLHLKEDYLCELSLDGIKQYYVNCAQDEWKEEAVRDLLENISCKQVLVYYNDKETVCCL